MKRTSKWDIVYGIMGLVGVIMGGVSWDLGWQPVRSIVAVIWGMVMVSLALIFHWVEGRLDGSKGGVMEGEVVLDKESKSLTESEIDWEIRPVGFRCMDCYNQFRVERLIVNKKTGKLTCPICKGLVGQMGRSECGDTWI